MTSTSQDLMNTLCNFLKKISDELGSILIQMCLEIFFEKLNL